MFRDENDNIIGPSVNAFSLRPGEGYLSVTWCEYFTGTPDEQLRCAIEAIRSSRNVGSKGYFCVANTFDLGVAAAEFGSTTREVYHPEDDNPAHAGVYGISADENQLLESLADDVWSEFWGKEAVDNLPLTECSTSEVAAEAIH